MRKLFAILFLLIFCYSLIGYHIVFKITRSQIESEVKHLLKHSVPKQDLIVFSFTNQEAKLLHWTKPGKEFRLNDKMYDVVETEKSKNNCITFFCIHDFKDSKLFKNLDQHIFDYLGLTGKKSKENKELIKKISHKFTNELTTRIKKQNIGFIYQKNDVFSFYKSIIKELLSPPPRVILQHIVITLNN